MSEDQLVIDAEVLVHDDGAQTGHRSPWDRLKVEAGYGTRTEPAPHRMVRRFATTATRALTRWRGDRALATLSSMPGPDGFDYVVRGEQVVINHYGRYATTLRGRRAQAFLEDVVSGDPQELMARLTGNYRRGNERQARNHPRHQRR